MLFFFLKNQRLPTWKVLWIPYVQEHNKTFHQAIEVFAEPKKFLLVLVFFHHSLLNSSSRIVNLLDFVPLKARSIHYERKTLKIMLYFINLFITNENVQFDFKSLTIVLQNLLFYLSCRWLSLQHQKEREHPIIIDTFREVFY